jgi:hypothetical protein
MMMTGGPGIKTPRGPAIVICPECGEEFGRDRISLEDGRTIILPLPRTCLVCDAFLVPKVRRVDEHQATLAGVI